MYCKRVSGIVHVLEAEFSGEMKFEVLDAFAPGNAQAIKANNLGTHGALAKTAAGLVIWTAPGHKQDRAKLMEGVRALRESGHE